MLRTYHDNPMHLRSYKREFPDGSWIAANFVPEGDGNGGVAFSVWVHTSRAILAAHMSFQEFNVLVESFSDFERKALFEFNRLIHPYLLIQGFEETVKNES